jgi:tetratricopeptide (TPR) repeat protein
MAPRDPGDARSVLRRAKELFARGRLIEARALVELAERNAPEDARLLDAIGTLYSRTNDQERALAAYERAVRLAPDNPQLLFNRATVRRFVGSLAAAEADYDRVIALRPDDYEAYRNRSELRRQTPERNHTAELERLLALGVPDWRAEVQLRYALAKEYEDVEDYRHSFAHLEQGARLRRAHLRYDVGADVATVDWIIQAFPAKITDSARQASAAGPIFIVGLPRSGSTLVDRILSSHSAVRSAGELNCFAHAVVEGVRRQSGGERCERRELVFRSAQLDFAALGRDYLERSLAAGATAPRFTDKMPLNHLYCGIIPRALPHSKIVHVSRTPTAACYAIYKSLFDQGYPYSYDLGELARYYAAYRRLMQHWHSTLPGQVHELRYEELILDQIGETRRLLEFCGLPWEDSCIEFHRNPAATTTASAAQVRTPLYDTSIAQWGHYRKELVELRRQLTAAGIQVEP